MDDDELAAYYAREVAKQLTGGSVGCMLTHLDKIDERWETVWTRYKLQGDDDDVYGLNHAIDALREHLDHTRGYVRVLEPPDPSQRVTFDRYTGKLLPIRATHDAGWIFLPPQVIDPEEES